MFSRLSLSYPLKHLPRSQGSTIFASNKRYIISSMDSPHIKQVVNDILRPQDDKRLYRGLELSNGMKVLLCSDESTDKSSAAMDVHIGHLMDPDDIPGLAHFCEHMLFLGTKEYPQENEYTKFLSEHSGSANAFTSSEHTNYYFDVAPDNLKETLHRFAQFFICPLFTATATEREVNAVNSENDKNLQSDSWRLYQLEKATADPKHPFSKFGTGNKYTLETRPKELNLDTRDELLKFHSKYYSSNLMALAVLGKESLDDLTEMVVNLFSQVENKNLEVPEWKDHPYGPDQCKLKANIVPVKDIRNLNITWPLPDMHKHYKSGPDMYLGHLIGHEGPGSLLSELKARGWVNLVVAGQKAGAKGFMFFVVNVDLTEEGIDHVDDIVLLTFQYLNMVKKEGTPDWVFKECQDLNNMTFRFKDKEKPRSFTCNSAGSLHDYPLKEVISGPYLLYEFKPELVTMLLEKLTPENIRIAVIGKKFEGETKLKEEWYGTEYSMEPIPQVLLNKLNNAGFHENLKLPEKNEFIPTNFDLYPIEEKAEKNPVILKETPLSRLWFKQDQKFLLPKCCVCMVLSSPMAFMDPGSVNHLYMYTQLFKDALNEYAYAASLAGLNYSLDTSAYGILLSVRGYNDKQHILLQKVIEKFTSFDIDPKRFQILKEVYGRGLKNFKAEQPHQHALYYTTVVVMEQIWTKDELLEALEDMTVETLKLYISKFLSKLFIESLVYGNVDKERASQLIDIVESTLTKKAQTKPLLLSQQKRYREVQLPYNSNHLYHRLNEVHKSSALEIYYQYEVQDTHTNMILELFCQIISEACFDVLRTKEQLGYIVVSGVRRANGVQGLRVLVQSDKSPAHVDDRVEAFLKYIEGFIADMSDEVFKKHVAAHETRILEQPKKLSTQHAKYWSEISSEQYNFNRDEVEVEHLRTLTKADVMEFYKSYVAADAPKRRKLAVHIESSAPADESDATKTENDEEDPAKDGNNLYPVPTLKEPVHIENVPAFKRTLGLFPLPKPHMVIGESFY
ncbi:insulin-degrading enzyme-like isoform X2 [Lineus longissimus]|uniref:insulin-degrading enzyme-like isoform X2 n=1 Tax=Lineus longissimus TaxID=88925 RepID=UPI00315D9DA4